MTEAVFVKNRFPQKNKTFYPLPMIKKADRFSLTQEFFPVSMKSRLLFYDFQNLIQTILSYDINKAFSVDFRLFFFSIVIPQLRTASVCFLYNGKVGSSSQTLHFLHNPRKNRKIRRQATAFPCFHIGIHTRKCRIFRQKALISAWSTAR